MARRDPAADPPSGFLWEEEVSALDPGDHHCHVFDRSDQSLAVLVPFVEQGLEAGHRCFATVAESSFEEVREELQDAGVDVQARLDAGDLVLRSHEETYGSPSSFDIGERVDDLRALVARSREEGYEVVRSIAEMSWAADEHLDRETVVRYEAALEDLLDGEEGEHLIGVCQYHVSTFEPSILVDVLRAHPLTIHGSRVSENLFYQPPDVLVSEEPDKMLDHMLGRLQERYG